MRLSQMGEFGLIRRLSATVGGREADPSGILVGIGDDAAVFRPAEGMLQVATADMLMEEVHFRRDWMSALDLGWKSLAVNLSDCAAMGAIPRYALVCIALNPACPPEYVEELYHGMQQLAERFGTRIAGGDTVASRGPLALSVTVVGEVEPERLATRAGARPGDRILVTGTLGDSAAGCAALYAGPDTVSRVPQAVLDAHRRPSPRVAEARAAVLHGGVTSMMDISDGLAGDLRHICEESNVGAEVLAARVPLSPAIEEAAAILGRDPLDLALSGGEDYELLFTASPDRAAAIAAAVTEATGTPVTDIGAILPAELLLRQPNGYAVPLPEAFRHFS